MFSKYYKFYNIIIVWYFGSLFKVNDLLTKHSKPSVANLDPIQQQQPEVECLPEITVPEIDVAGNRQTSW